MDGGCCGLDDQQLEWHLNDYAAHKSAEDNRELIEAIDHFLKGMDKDHLYFIDETDKGFYSQEPSCRHRVEKLRTLIQKHKP